MKTLIIKLGASGDVIRTTVLLHFVDGEVDWLTSEMNAPLVNGLPHVRAITWTNRYSLKGRAYDFVINLEDDRETAAVLEFVAYGDLYGAYSDGSGRMAYTDNAAPWFDLGIISRYGLARANELKLRNRESFQRLICRGLGFSFVNEPYLLPPTPQSELSGDVAVSLQSGAVWPMKNWIFYPDLIERLRADGLTVNILPMRATILEHIADIKNHRVLVSGDSLPMHCALGSNVPCVTLFICTSPWEIHDYGIQEKIISPDLERYFYRRDFDPEAARSVSLSKVHERTMALLNRSR